MLVDRFIRSIFPPHPHSLSKSPLPIPTKMKVAIVFTTLVVMLALQCRQGQALTAHELLCQNLVDVSSSCQNANYSIDETVCVPDSTSSSCTTGPITCPDQRYSNNLASALATMRSGTPSCVTLLALSGGTCPATCRVALLQILVAQAAPLDLELIDNSGDVVQADQISLSADRAPILLKCASDAFGDLGDGSPTTLLAANADLFLLAGQLPQVTQSIEACLFTSEEVSTELNRQLPPETSAGFCFHRCCSTSILLHVAIVVLHTFTFF